VVTIKPGIEQGAYTSNLVNGINEWNSSSRIQTFNYLKDKNIKTAADIGANFGVFSDKCLSELSDLEYIHSVEPDDKNFEILTFNLGDKPKALLHHCGIFYGATEVKVVGIGDNSPGGYMVENVNSFHHGQWTNRLYVYEDKIFKVKTLEEILLKPVDLLKIDVEGSEYNIIEHSTLLHDCRYLIVEFHNHADDYVRFFLSKYLSDFKVLEFTNDTYGSHLYWYVFMEKNNDTPNS